MNKCATKAFMGLGIGIRGLFIYGKAFALVGVFAPVVAVLLSSNFTPDWLAGVRAGLAEFRAPRTDAPEAFADACAPWAGFPAPFAEARDAAADARDARGEMPFSTIHTLQLTT